MPTAAQLARLAAIGRQSVNFYQNPAQIGSISTHHRAAVARIRTQGRQSITVVDGQIEGNVPAVPGSVAASTLSSSSIRVTCADVPNENGYKWFRSLTNDSATAVQVGSTAMNVAAFTDSGLTASTTYYYWVKATNGNGDSAFSTGTSSATSAPVTPGDGTADQILGTYLGHFRITQTGFGARFFGGARPRVITQHPDNDKLYYIVSGPGTQDLGTSAGQRGYIGTMTIPSIASLDPSHSDTQSPFATPATPASWVELIEDYADDRVSRGIVTEANKFKDNRLYGVAYDSASGKLWVNFGKNYATGIQPNPCVREINPTTLQPIGDFYMPSGNGATGPVNGQLVPLAATSLSALGDFAVTPSWLANSAGPRWRAMDIDGGNYSATIVHDLMAHELVSPHPSSSLACQMRGACISGTNFFTLMSNGVQGWYGGPSGFGSDGSYLGGPQNIVPDPWKNTKGWHAPPYKAEIWSCPLSEIEQVANGTRSPDACNYTIVDISSRMLRQKTTDVLVGGAGPSVSLTTKQCDVTSIAKMNGYFFIMENLATTANPFEPEAVIHVWSGDN